MFADRSRTLSSCFENRRTSLYQGVRVQGWLRVVGSRAKAPADTPAHTPDRAPSPMNSSLFCPECESILDLPGDDDFVVCAVCGTKQAASRTPPKSRASLHCSIRGCAAGDTEPARRLCSRSLQKKAQQQRQLQGADSQQRRHDQGKVSALRKPRDDVSHDAAAVGRRRPNGVLRVPQMQVSRRTGSLAATSTLSTHSCSSSPPPAHGCSSSSPPSIHRPFISKSTPARASLQPSLDRQAASAVQASAAVEREPASRSSPRTPQHRRRATMHCEPAASCPAPQPKGAAHEAAGSALQYPTPSAWPDLVSACAGRAHQTHQRQPHSHQADTPRPRDLA